MCVCVYVCIFLCIWLCIYGDRGGTVVKVLCYKLEGPVSIPDDH